jgi:hypothetical protein
LVVSKVLWHINFCNLYICISTGFGRSVGHADFRPQKKFRKLHGQILTEK